jgi:hypothetical protein
MYSTIQMTAFILGTVSEALGRTRHSQLHITTS